MTSGSQQRRAPAACTIASNNYLAMAKVLATSFRDKHPDSEVWVCVVDRPDPAIDYQALPFRCVFAQDLGIPKFLHFAFRYDILELNTAVKPFLLAYLRDHESLDRVIYFDPDIWILDRVDALFRLLDEHPMVLTPHVTAPLDDDYDPAERKLLQVGVYNLGFLGLRLDDSTRAFLDWWQDRLYRFCLNDPAHGLFVDQQWASFAPAFVDDVAIVRDPVYNVAYWNLVYRRPVFEQGAWRIDGRKVAFFHFSGVSFDNLTTVSRHQDRMAPGSRPELRPLFEAYRDVVEEAGHREWQRHPYTYGHFLDREGRQVAPIPGLARRMLQRADPHARRWSRPFDAEASDSFYRWIREPIEVAGCEVNRIMLALWEQRDDLIQRFPDVQGFDLPRYLEWLAAARKAGELPMADEFSRPAGGELSGRIEAQLPNSESIATPPPFRVRREDSEAYRRLCTQGGGNLTTWLNEPVPGRSAPEPIVTRVMMMLYELRPDLHALYPDPLGDHQRAFAYWFCSQGSEERGITEDLVEPVRKTLSWKARLGSMLRKLRNRGSARGERDVGVEPAQTVEPAPAADTEVAATGDAASESSEESVRAEETTLRRGVQIVGLFGRQASPEESASSMAETLEASGTDWVAVPLDQDVWGKSAERRIHQPDGAPFDLSILRIPPHRTLEALSVLPVPVRVGGRVVAYWSWHLAHLHLGVLSGVEFLDEIWVPSEFVRRAVEPLAEVPVRLVPPYVAVPRDIDTDRGLHGPATDRTICFACFDADEVLERANPFALLNVWRRWSESGEPAPWLSLRVARADRDPDLVAELRRRGESLPIRIHDDPGVHEDALLASCDAWISLDRGSALGVRTVRAMRLGKPVVATGYGGADDYLDSEVAYPVRSRRVRLRKHHGPFPAGAVWAEPDLGHARAQILSLLEDPEEAQKRAAAGRRRAEALFGQRAAAAAWADALESCRRGAG